MGPHDLALCAGVGVLVVALFVASFFRRTGTSIREQLDAAQRLHRAPDRTLAVAEVSPGVSLMLRASVTRREEEHSVWLEYLVDPGDGTGQWRAEVDLSARVGSTSEPAARFPIGYDGEDHLTRKGLVGVTYVPTPGSSVGIDDGHLRLATLPRGEAGAPIEVNVSLVPAVPYPRGTWKVSIRVAPPPA